MVYIVLASTGTLLLFISVIIQSWFCGKKVHYVLTEDTRSESYVYWTVHHCESWGISDQIDIISYYILFHFFYAQYISDINTSIIRSLRVFYCITTLVVCSCFDVLSPCHTDTNPTQPHRKSNTHRKKNTRTMWWYNGKVAGSWRCKY